MKKRFLLLTLISLFVIGCSKKDNTNNQSNPGSDSQITDSGNNDSDQTIPVTSVLINQEDEVEVELGKNVVFTATVLPENATNKKVTWASTNTFVATINSGNITTKSVGVTTIIVKSKENNEIFDQCTLKVISPKATGVTLNKTSLSLNTGYDETLTATITPANTGKTVVWSSNDESIATVNQNGKVTAIKAGSTAIKATVDSFTAICNVEVTQSQLADLPKKTPLVTSTIVKQNNDYFYATASSGYKDVKKDIGDGVEYHVYTLPGVDGVTRTGYSIIVDLSKASIEAGTPENSYYFNRAAATVYNQALAFDTASKTKKVMAAMNADYFGCGTSCAINNLFVKDGVVVNTKAAFKDDSATSTLKSGMMAFGISYNDVPVIAEGTSVSNYDYRIDNMVELYDAKGKSLLASGGIDAINNKLIQNNHEGTARSRDFEAYTVTGLSVANKNILILDIIKEHGNGVGDVGFPVDGVINEIKKNYTGTLTLLDSQLAVAVDTNMVNKASVGKIVRVGRTESDNDKFDNMKVVLGGRHELVRDSKVVSTVANETTNSAKTARGRSAVGILTDGRVMLFAIPDGNNDMNLVYLADFMEYHGCKYAMNFDGGGSTRLLVDNGYNGSGTLEAKAAGGENRKVVNTILVTTK